MDNKLYDDWKFPVSLTATISILIGAHSAAMMHGVSEFISQLKWTYYKKKPRKLCEFSSFDEASRGSYGALALLLRGPWNLATIGACITLFQSAFGPMTQQVVELQPLNISTPDRGATIGYAHVYDRGIGGRMVNHKMSQSTQ